MPSRSQASRVADRMAERMTKLANKIKEQNPEPFGVTQYSPAEFRKRAIQDEAFRISMSRQMGPANFLRVMQGENDASPPIS